MQMQMCKWCNIVSHIIIMMISSRFAFFEKFVAYIFFFVLKTSFLHLHSYGRIHCIYWNGVNVHCVLREDRFFKTFSFCVWHQILSTKKTQKLPLVYGKKSIIFFVVRLSLIIISFIHTTSTPEHSDTLLACFVF